MPASTRFAVAVHILAVLAHIQGRGGELVSSDLIAMSVGTHAVVIRQLLRALKKAALIQAKEGKGGGVSLARAASKITLQEIYAAVEPSGALGPLAGNDKPVLKQCPISRSMGRVFGEIACEVDQAVTHVLKGKTLADVVARI